MHTKHQALLALLAWLGLCALGPRLVHAQAPDAVLCGNGCWKANDGICDDGRVGAATNLCPHGTDCADCGVAKPYTRRPTVANVPTVQPTIWRPSGQDEFTQAPSQRTTKSPTSKPTKISPTSKSTKLPTQAPTNTPTTVPTLQPSTAPTFQPTSSPTFQPTNSPIVPTSSPISLAAQCASKRTRAECCGPIQMLKDDCEYIGCKWSASTKKCVRDSAPPKSLRSQVTG